VVRQRAAAVVVGAARSLSRLRDANPWRYPLVEAMTAVLLRRRGWSSVRPSNSPSPLRCSPPCSRSHVIDLRHQIIPDAITFPGILAGITANVATRHLGWADVALGIVLGGGIFFRDHRGQPWRHGAGDMKTRRHARRLSRLEDHAVGLMVGVVLVGAWQWL